MPFDKTDPPQRISAIAAQEKRQRDAEGTIAEEAFIEKIDRLITIAVNDGIGKAHAAQLVLQWAYRKTYVAADGQPDLGAAGGV